MDDSHAGAALCSYSGEFVGVMEYPELATSSTTPLSRFLMDYRRPFRIMAFVRIAGLSARPSWQQDEIAFSRCGMETQ